MGLQRRMQVIDGGAPSDKETNIMDSAIKVAFATSDMTHVDQHFGSAKSFAVYAINPDDVKLLEFSQFGRQDQDGNEDKLVSKMAVLDGCAAVYCHAIGAITALPLVLPPTVLGFYLLVIMGGNGALGQMWMQLTGHPLSFSFEGLVVASCIYSLPFVVQPLQAAFEELDRHAIEAAWTLDASRNRYLITDS